MHSAWASTTRLTGVLVYITSVEPAVLPNRGFSIAVNAMGMDTALLMGQTDLSTPNVFIVMAKGI